MSVQALFDILVVGAIIVLAVAVIGAVRRVRHLSRLIDVLSDAALYEVAKTTCLSRGLPWTDPRTGITFRPMDDEGER